MRPSKPFSISPRSRVRETPSDHLASGTPTDYSLKFNDFIQPPPKTRRKKNAPPPPYLIVGFDTEYQAPAAPVERSTVVQHEAKYQVLSYQFHCLSSAGQSWSGICCPDDGERISLGEYLVFALGKGIKDGVIDKLPTKIYLVGHFTRADVPAFSDFKQLQAIISAVRKTFVSIDQSITMEIPFRTDKVRLSILLRDTMLLSPGGSQSLSAVGDLIGRPKVVLDRNPTKELAMKRNMARVRHDSWDVYRDYALNDAVICVEYLKKIGDLCETVIGRKKFPVTLTSIGVDLLLKSWTDDLRIDPLSVLGREVVTEHRWDKRHGHYKTFTKQVSIEECFWNELFVTETYHGGRNEQFWFGPCYEADWTDYDLASAYPTAMSLIGIPYWEKFYFSREIKDYTPTTLGYACVDFKFPDHVRYPTLPVRTQNGLIFPLEGRSYCAAPEIVAALSLGATVTIRHGVIVPTDDKVRIFGKFIGDCLAKRKQYAKKSFEGLFWKEIANSTYGKTAQGLREKRVFDMRDQEMKPLPPSRITNPFFASYITSFVRAVLGEIINAIPDSKMVFSATTDGFITDATEREIKKAENGTLGKLFAAGRKTLTGTATVLEKKHAVRLPLGWRTRGQATLIEGERNDEDPAYSVVLARGGISLDDDLDTPQQQSAYVARLFFNRTPSDTVTSSSLTGLRDMIFFDADLVPVETVKRLSMEFDWKRRPKALGHHSKYYKHLVFSTAPWRTVKEFRQVRELWTEFQKKRPMCLKSRSDFETFSAFADNVLMMSEGDKKYLATKDGDLKRLRQMLCVAWRQRLIGFTGFGTYKLKSENSHRKISSEQEFADFLTACSLPTKRSDVTNAARKKIRYNSCPPTKRCREIVETIKQIFSDLEVEHLFSKNNLMASLSPSSSATCPFVQRIIGASNKELTA